MVIDIAVEQGRLNVKGMEKKMKEYQRLTIEDVRKHKGFDKYTDEEITKIIAAVEKLSLLIYKKFANNNSNQNNDEQIS